MVTLFSTVSIAANVTCLDSVPHTGLLGLVCLYLYLTVWLKDRDIEGLHIVRKMWWKAVEDDVVLSSVLFPCFDVMRSVAVVEKERPVLFILAR